MSTGEISSYTKDILTVEIGKQSKIIVALSTGRNAVSKAMLRLSAPSGVRFDVDELTVEGNGMLQRFCPNSSPLMTE